jgi:hypothetical protein
VNLSATRIAKNTKNKGSTEPRSSGFSMCLCDLLVTQNSRSRQNLGHHGSLDHAGEPLSGPRGKNSICGGQPGCRIVAGRNMDRILHCPKTQFVRRANRLAALPPAPAGRIEPMRS